MRWCPRLTHRRRGSLRTSRRSRRTFTGSPRRQRRTCASCSTATTHCPVWCCGLLASSRRKTTMNRGVPHLPTRTSRRTSFRSEDLCQLFHRNDALPCVVLRTSRFFPEEDDDESRRAAFADENLKANEFQIGRPVPVVPPQRRTALCGVADFSLLPGGRRR